MAAQDEMAVIHLTPRELAAVTEAAPLFKAAVPHARNFKQADGQRPKYEGPTADEVLAKHGIGNGYRRGQVTYATIINAVIDGFDLNNLPHRVARDRKENLR